MKFGVRLAVTVMALGAIAGCSLKQTPLQIGFASPELQARVQAVELSIRRETCSGPSIYEAVLNVGSQSASQMPPRLSPGQYAVAARGYSSDCRLVAEVCQISRLPLPDGVQLIAILEPTGVGAGCPNTQRCENGRCITDQSWPDASDGQRLDARLDTPSFDQGLEDTQVDDAAQDALPLNRCGDGVTDTLLGEDCDDNNTVTEACPYGQMSCTVCGSSCRTTNGSATYCGDGVVDTFNAENCEDGNSMTEPCVYGQTSCTVCSSVCQSIAGATSYCGDGNIQAVNGETCEDGNGVVGDGCSNCRMETPQPDCRQWLAAGANVSGVFTIDPDGSGGVSAFSVYCDMTTDGGGWTLLGTLGDPRLLPNLDRYLQSVTTPGLGLPRLLTQHALVVGSSFRVGRQVGSGTNTGNFFQINDCDTRDAGCWYGNFISQNDGDTFGAWLTQGGSYGVTPSGCESDACPALDGDRDHSQGNRIAIFGGDCYSNCADGQGDTRNGLRYWDFGSSGSPSRIGNRAFWSIATMDGVSTNLELSGLGSADWGQSGSLWRDIWIR